jgi:hypothetical protein
MDSYRDDDEEDPSDDYRSDAYWRRRAITLALGLVLLAVLIWAFTGGGGQPASPAATGSQQPSLQPEAAYSAVPTAPPATQGPLNTPTARNTVETRPSASARAAAQSGRKGGKGGKGGKGAKKGTGGGAGSGTGGQCSPGDIVLSLVSNKSSYGAGEDPRFEVYVVSTAPAACTFGLGPAKLQVQVMSAGRIVWDSADCARADRTRVATLKRGVPSQESITWNRTSTLPGCATLTSSVRPGTYQVRVKDGGAASAVLAIKLTRLEFGPEHRGQRLPHILDPDDLKRAREAGRVRGACRVHGARRHDRAAETHPLRLGQPVGQA